MNEYFVYGLVDPRDDSVFYVGKGKGERPLYHLRETGEQTYNRRKFNKIKSIRDKGFEPTVRYLAEGLSETDALACERKLIAQYGRKDIDDGGVLTNIAVGGDLWGGSIPEQTRDKIRDKMSGVNHPNYGKPRSNELKQRQRDYKEQWWANNTLRSSRKGSTHTEETRQLLSRLHKGKTGLAGSSNPMHTARRYNAVNAQGVAQEVTSRDIKSFCASNDLNYGNLMTAIRAGKRYRGWTVTRLSP